MDRFEELTRYRQPRRIGWLHLRGLITLQLRALLQLKRFAVSLMAGPLVQSLLFITVFSFALPEGEVFAGGVEPLLFLGTGVASYAAFYSAFDNGGFPIMMDKIEGMIGDLLASPLTPYEMVVGYIIGGAIGGLITGSVVFLMVGVMVPLTLVNPFQVLVFALLGSFLFSTLGYLVGLWAQKWDRYSFAETFFVLPLSMLSATFYEPTRLPDFGQMLLSFNPVYYAVDGLRSGFTGIAYSPPLLSGLVVAACALLLCAFACLLTARGYRIKA